MDLKSLIARARAETQDKATPLTWSDPEWRDYLNEAADEAAIRAALIEDDQIVVDLSAGEPYAEYPSHAWSIRRVRIDNRTMLLVDKEMLDQAEGEGWEEQTGTPIACYEISGRLRFFPTPTQDCEAAITAYCVPEKKMSSNSDEPGINPRLHIHLLDWALHLAYLKKDTDYFDPAAADKYEASFEKKFGPRPDEKAMRQKRINIRHRVRGSFF